jgi:filamentous hemagglutinin family protein
MHKNAPARAVVSRRTAPARSAMGRMVAISMALTAGTCMPVWAQSPTGGQVVNGSGTIAQSGAMTTITAGNGAIINWQTFSIGQGQTVQFIQPGATSTVLNRVVTATPSIIDGNLFANGRVFLVNPAGVMFGQNAVVNVGGLVAGAASMSDSDFLSGDIRFTNAQGTVVNNGQIKGGEAVLFGRNVENNGLIVAEQGTVMLMAGDDMFVGKVDGQVFAKVSSKPDNGTDKPGVSNTGVIDARGGSVRMAATDVFGQAVWNSGTVRASDVTIEAQRTGHGHEDSTVIVSGTIDATNAAGKGGNVSITGTRVLIDDADINASGSQGGGTIRIGGDFRGQGSMDRADRVVVSNDSTLTADATANGTGGTVIVWSELFTNFQGSASARGGSEGGDGGLIETSSRQNVFLNPVGINASAAKGKNGLWLIDPRNITIATSANANGAFAGTDPLTFTPSANDAVVNVASINDALALGTSVTITTSDPTGDQQGNILLESGANITRSAAGSATITLLAANNITLNGNITSTSGSTLNVVLKAGDPAQQIEPNGGNPARTGTLNIATGFIELDAGDIYLHAGTGGINLGNAVNTDGAGATIRMVADGNITQTGGGIFASNLGIQASGNVDLMGLNNRVDVLAADVGGTLRFRNTVGFTIGTVGASALAPEYVLVEGIESSNDDAMLIANTGSLTLANNIDLGTGILRLLAQDGISQNSTSIITASGLAALNTSSNAISLTSANNITGPIAAANVAGGGAVTIRNSVATTIGTVAAATGFNADAALSGIFTNTGDITLNTAALSLEQALSAAGATVRLRTTGGISQTAAGIITADDLGVINSLSGNIVLDDANDVGVIAGENTASDGTFVLRSTSSLTVGSVSTIAELFARPAVPAAVVISGITTTPAAGTSPSANDVTLSTAGSLILEQAITAGRATVRFQSATGMSQTAAGIISARALGLVNSDTGSIVLDQANAIVDGLAALNKATGGEVVFLNTSTSIAPGTSALNITGVTGVANLFSAGDLSAGTEVVGVRTTGNGNALLRTNGTMNIDAVINVGAGILRLQTGSGVNQEGGADAAITAGFLAAFNSNPNGAVTTGRLAFFNDNNQVSAIAGRNNNGDHAPNQTGVGADVSIFTIPSLTIGELTTTDSRFADGAVISGIKTFGPNGGSQIISRTGTLTLERGIDNGAGGTYIQGGTGVIQLSGAGITSGTLIAANSHQTAALTTGDVLLFEENNIARTGGLGRVGITNLAKGGLLRFRNISGFETNAQNNPGLVQSNGFVTTNNDAGPFTNTMTIVAGGQIQVLEQINAGSGNVFMQAAGGINGDAAISAGTLALVNNVSGGIDLRTAINRVSTLAIRNNVESAFIAFRNEGNLTVGSIAAPDSEFNDGLDVVGVSGKGNTAIGLHSRTGSLTLNQAVNAGFGGVFLHANKGISQSSTGLITAGALSAYNGTFNASDPDPTGDIVLDQANILALADTTDAPALAIRNDVAGGKVVFRSAGAQGFVTDASDAIDNLINAITGVSTGTGGRVSLIASGGSMFLGNTVSALGGDVRLTALTSVNQAGNGRIFADRLGVVVTGTGEGFVTLGAENRVGFVAISNNADGNVQFRSIDNLTVGKLAAESDFNAGTELVGISTRTGRNISVTGKVLTINDAPLQTNLGLLTLTGTQSILLNQNLLSNGGDIVVNGPVVLGGNILVSSRFNGVGTYAGAGSILFNGDILATGSDGTRTLTILTPVGPEVAAGSLFPPRVVFNGTRIGTETERLASVLINADDARTNLPGAATIVFGASRDIDTLVYSPIAGHAMQVFTSDQFTAGALERTTALGSLSFNSVASRSNQLTLGDLTVLGDLNVFTNDLRLRLQPVVPMNVVVGGNLDLGGSTPVAFGPGLPGTFNISNSGVFGIGAFPALTIPTTPTAADVIAENGRTIITLGRIGRLAVDLTQTFSNGTPLGVNGQFIPGSGPNVAAFAGLLEELALQIRESEFGSGFTSDVPEAREITADNIRVSRDRLSNASIDRLLSVYNLLYTIEGDSIDPTTSSRDAIASALEQAWQEYESETGIKADVDPIGFRLWLEARERDASLTPTQRLALTSLNRAREVFRALDQAGLTRVEAARPRGVVLTALGAGWLEPAAVGKLEVAIEGFDPALQ